MLAETLKAMMDEVRLGEVCAASGTASAKAAAPASLAAPVAMIGVAGSQVEPGAVSAAAPPPALSSIPKPAVRPASGYLEVSTAD